MRLDQYLVEQGFFQTRARARDAILRGTVEIDGAAARKPSQKIAQHAQVHIDDPAQAYVSRAALKLKEGLVVSGFSASGKICLDIGASTGGFTQVLLEDGAAKVHAIDVGHDQLVASLAKDSRVMQQDGLNARTLTSQHLQGDAPQMLVSDVSFISLKLALPPALALAAHGAQGIFLVKPQFEVGRERIGKGGLVDQETAADCANELAYWLSEQSGWQVLGLCPSPIKGGDGNTEYLLYAQKSG
ncbi:TlyA family RNA methyltransferase [Polycladidibacter hongkongensis]|uniref:TlyA family RNA methyltransferase n=1 Tax=Polycladidibacter hongkongensis TaxID=1647556 RepID=UPI0008345235|nr:TlyA family RNA methyltransferase [Pseudovibrio hongkongensis]